MEKREDIIILRAYHPSKNPECRICPVRDETGNTYTGQGESGYFEALTEAEIRSLEKTGALVNPKTRKRITNDYMIRLNNSVGKAEWGWMQKHPYIDTEMKEEEVKSKRSLFYVYDEQREAEIQVSKTKGKTLLLAKIYEMSLTEKKELYEALGLGSSATLTDEMLEVALEGKINSDLNVVKKVLANRDEIGKQDTGARKLYHSAVNYRVIEKQSNGMYTFGGEEGIPLGRKEDDIVDFLLLPANGETVIAIQESVDKLSK